MCRISPTHVEPARSRARLVIALLGTGLLAGACADKPAPPPPPPPEVLVTPVVRRDVPVPWSSWARPAARRTSRSGRVSRASSTSSASRKARWCARARCSIASIASRSRRRWRTRRPNWRPRRPATRRRRTTSSACSRWLRSRPSASRNSTTPSPLQDAARCAGRGAQGGRRTACARSRLHERHLADRRPRSARRWSRPAASSAAGRARC